MERGNYPLCSPSLCKCIFPAILISSYSPHVYLQECFSYHKRSAIWKNCLKQGVKHYNPKEHSSYPFFRVNIILLHWLYLDSLEIVLEKYLKDAKTPYLERKFFWICLWDTNSHKVRLPVCVQPTILYLQYNIDIFSSYGSENYERKSISFPALN